MYILDRHRRLRPRGMAGHLLRHSYRNRHSPYLRVEAVSRMVVGSKELWSDAARQVILDACLLASQKASHGAP